MVSEATLKANFRKAIEPYKTDKYEYVRNRGGYMNKIQKYNISESDVESINTNLKYGRVMVDKVDFDNKNRHVTFIYDEDNQSVVFSYPLLFIRPVNPYTLADGEVRFEEGETYTGYYDDSKKKVSVTFYGLEESDRDNGIPNVLMSCSTMPNRYSRAPLDKAFTIEEGVQKLHFYNVFHDSCSQQIDYITVYADNRTESREKVYEEVESKFEVGKTYKGEMDVTNHYGIVVKTLWVNCLCTKRTAKWVHFKWTTKSEDEIEGKMFTHIHYLGNAECGTLKCEGYRDIYLESDQFCSN